MVELPAAYFGELARQLAFVSAVLGGFAATFFGTLLDVESPKRVVGFATASAAVAAACFVCTTLAATFIAVGSHPEAPSVVTERSTAGVPRLALVLFMALGMYALCASLGAGGWVRSKTVGIVTTTTAILSAAFVTWALLGF